MSDKKNYTLFKLARAKNGYILEKRDVIDGVPTEVEELVGTDGEEEIETFRRFLWDIDENYGPATSRYDAKRIQIRIEPGDKTDADSEELDFHSEWILGEKGIGDTWAEYGEKIHKMLTERVKESKAFKQRNDYK
jgi:hypothetical protein